MSDWPCAPDGTPLVKVSGCVSDLVPTAQYANVTIGPVSITRMVDARDAQAIIDATRETQRMAEFVCGIERRLLQWTLDPASKVRSPVDAKEAFSAPPASYNPNGAPDPRVPIEASEAAQAAAAAAQTGGVTNQPPGAPVPTQPRMNTHAANTAGPQVG